MPIRCEIVSQDRVVYQGDADMVILPGTAGEMGVLPHHAPVLTTLKFGVVKVRRGGADQVFAVSGGQTFAARVRRLGGDSASVAMGGAEFVLRLAAAGSLVSGGVHGVGPAAPFAVYASTALFGLVTLALAAWRFSRKDF